MAELKINANTSGAKKSLLDLTKSIKNLGSTKTSIFSEQDRKFIKSELNRELSTMKNKLVANKNEIAAMVSKQKDLVKGSQEELAVREDIIKGYETQAKLAADINKLESSKKKMGFTGGMAGRGGIMGMLGKGLGMGMAAIGGAALSAVAYGGYKTMQAGDQFEQGAANRVRLRGLGVEGDNFGTPEELAKAGMSEQDMIERRMNATARLGREGASQESLMGQGRFERAFGLENGTMTNVSTSLRAQFGGKGADQAQQKLQASILASGIEDALGPYLESATQLLSSINENGVTNTEEITRMFGELVKDNARTPEQIANAFHGIDSAIKGSKGEANAFLQNAFGRAGIGGGTIGATRLAIEEGGIFGVNREEMSKRGYSKGLLDNMQKRGMFAGTQERSTAVLNQFKSNAGLRQDQRFSDITDNDQRTQLAHMANSILGTKGGQGFDALLMLEQVQRKQMSHEDFNKRLENMKTNDDPTVSRLTKINETLAGQLTVQTAIKDNLMEALGKKGGAQTKMALQEANIQGIKATTNTVSGINDTGLIDATRRGINKSGDYLWTKLPDKLSDAMLKVVDKIRSGPGQVRNAQSIGLPKVSVKIQNSDGKVKETVHKSK